MITDEQINTAQNFLKHWQKVTSRPMTSREVEFAKAIRNEALEEAAKICRTEIQAGIKANDDQWMVCADLLRTKILDLKEQQ